MKNRPIHENLDTSFVNLSALIKYLRRRQFAGQVRIELSGYEADIYLSAENITRVREHDHIAGRVAEGQEAFQRILIRSREPGGIVSVYQTVADVPEIAPRIEKPVDVPVAPSTPARPVRVEPSPVEVVQAKAANGNGAVVNGSVDFFDVVPAPTLDSQAPKSSLPNLPFEFTNKVEDRAKRPDLSADDRKLLLELASELIGTVDRSLAMAKLDFPSAFKKSRLEIAGDYPFLKTLCYEKGRIVYIEEQTNPKILIAGILESLKRILTKLGANPKFGDVYRYTTQRILGLLHKRRAHYDRFNISRQLEKIVGA